MTDPIKPVPTTLPAPTLTKEELEEKAKEEKRNKEKEAVKKQVEDAAKAHEDLGKKFLKEDAEEAEKKAENKK